MPNIIGLDLGKHTIRAVEIERNKGTNTLVKFGTFETGNFDFNSDSPEDIKRGTELLKSFIQDTSFNTSNTVVGLPENLVYMRMIKVPKISDKELKNSIPYEAEQYIPLPLKEVSLTYQKLGDSYSEKGKIEVQLVAAKKTILEKYVQVLKASKLIPRGIEPETLAIGRALGDNNEHPSASIILNVGYSESLIIIVYRGNVMFTRSLGVGGDALTRSISQDLSLDYGQAEEYKKVYGMDGSQVEGKIFAVLKPYFESIVAEVKRSKIFFTTHNPNITINSVILSGGTALMPGLFYYMANNLDLEVALANPWRNVQISEKLSSNKETLMAQGPLYAIAVGLALKEI